MNNTTIFILVFVYVIFDSKTYIKLSSGEKIEEIYNIFNVYLIIISYINLKKTFKIYYIIDIFF